MLMVGCGDNHGDRIDCSWFAHPNCWRDTVAAAASCRSTDVAPGVLNGATCTFTDGVGVTFATAPDLGAGLTNYPWDFVIERDATSCASVVDTDQTLTVTTTLGAFQQEVSGYTLRLNCPNGDVFEMGAMDAFSCDFATLPGYAYAWSATFLSFSLIGNPNFDGQLFTCEP